MTNQVGAKGETCQLLLIFVKILTFTTFEEGFLVKDAGMNTTIKNCLNTGHARDRYHDPYLQQLLSTHTRGGACLNRRFSTTAPYPKINIGQHIAFHRLLHPKSSYRHRRSRSSDHPAQLS
jgi:hypothetical protein